MELVKSRVEIQSPLVNKSVVAFCGQFHVYLVLLITPFCVLVAHFVHEKKSEVDSANASGTQALTQHKKKKNTGIPYIAYLLCT